MRVLHLIDGDGWAGSHSTLALMASAVGRIAGLDEHIILFGSQKLQAAASDAGVPENLICRAPVPFQRAAMSPRYFKQTVASLGQSDVLHCWTIGCATMAALRFPNIPRLLSITRPPGKRACHWLRMLVHELTVTGSGDFAPTIMLPMSNTIRRTLLSAGVPEANVHVLRPAIDMGIIDNAAKTSLRKKWCHAHPTLAERGRNPIVLALLSDPPANADAYFAALAMSISDETRADRDLFLVVHPDQRNRARAESMLRRARNVKRIIREPLIAEPWKVLPACDGAIACDGSSDDLNTGGKLPLLWAMAAGVPIIGDATYGNSEIVEDHHSALLYQPHVIRDLARRTAELFDDPQLAWQLKDTARHECYSFFSRKTYCSNLQLIFEQTVAGKPIEIPEMEVTGGLRFAGRA